MTEEALWSFLGRFKFCSSISDLRFCVEADSDLSSSFESSFRPAGLYSLPIATDAGFLSLFSEELLLSKD